MRLSELVSYLDDYLAVSHVPDYEGAFNGLQVEGRRDVRKVAAAVDACQATIDAAIAGGADLLMVHHGLLWSHGPVTGPTYRRLSALIDAGVGVYACHLPLDAHPEVGNNRVLARGLGLPVGGPFAEYQGSAIGVWCETDVDLADLAERIRAYLGVAPHVIATGPRRVRRLAIVSGGAGRCVSEAAAAGCDTLLTGEGSHQTYFEAEELGVNLIYAGHYATETVGIRALAQHIDSRLGLQTFFVEHPTGL